jgi:acetyl-CoA/propionyl-CoA carboxylase biotin carboxyl carrier protein
MGVETVAVYSEADADAPFVAAADLAIAIGGAAAAESYLNIPKIIAAAKRARADAVHPGYGFLSENATFAKACEDEGVTFVGPPSQVIALMGSKTSARAAVTAAGVPVVPGAIPEAQTDDAIAAAVALVGFPALLKAASGGGGKGMRAVRATSEVLESIRAARREAERSFGRGALYVERLIDRARHIEVQILADTYGAVVHLFERDCTLQRRHQKVIEEAPAPTLHPGVRDRLTRAAVSAARAVGYVNAGTVECLLQGDGEGAEFFFLEMNTRLQVEHPVTEAITGIDLVQAQIRIAAGEPLPFSQEDVHVHGHAIECRIYAEDPQRGFQRPLAQPRNGAALARAFPSRDRASNPHSHRKTSPRHSCLPLLGLRIGCHAQALADRFAATRPRRLKPPDVAAGHLGEAARGRCGAETATNSAVAEFDIVIVCGRVHACASVCDT